MKAQLLMLSAAGLLLAASAAHAAPSPAQRFVDKAEVSAAARLSQAGVQLAAQGVAVRGTVHGDQRLTNVRVVRSSGSLELDARIETALRGLKVETPPTELVGRQVTITLDEGAATPLTGQP